MGRLTNLAPAEAMERRLATIESMAIDVTRRAYPSISETALVAGILREEHRLDRDLAEAWSRLVSLDSIRPLQSMTDLHAIAAAVDREPLTMRLRAITRSKLWETLQLNAVSEMDRLMDIYETAPRLPLNDERLFEIARRAVRDSMPELTSAIG